MAVSGKQCRFCGSDQDVSRVKGRFYACKTCRPAVYAVINSPEVIEQVWPLLHDRAILPQSRRIKIPWKTDIPETLDAKRHKAMDREDNSWYVIVSEYNQHPVEVFASTARDTDHRFQSRIAELTALTRLVSLIMRHIVFGERITWDKVRNQLSRSSRQQRDLPDMLLSVLDKYQCGV